MLNVLFVDDELNVLSGLRRILRIYRDQWNVEFTNSGQSALEVLEAKSFDVVVSDMRMPGMDGAELLERIASQCPSTIRIILSGQASQEASLRSVGPAHQFLSKPCSANLLKETVDRACVLRATLGNPALRNLVTRIETLPSRPQVFERLIHELSSPHCSIDRVSRTIGEDVAMTAKILQLVNSSFFGLAQSVTNVSHAISLLGLGLIKSLVLTASVFRHFEGTAAQNLSLDAFVGHSMLVAKLAGMIAAHETSSSHVIDDTLAAGMLHDIGKLILAAELPQAYREYTALPRPLPVSACHVERAIFGAHHAEVGGYLLALWALPNTVVDTVTFHHAPESSPVTTFSPLAAVHVADTWLRARLAGQPNSECDEAFLRRAGVWERIPAWLRLFADFTCEVERSSSASRKQPVTARCPA